MRIVSDRKGESIFSGASQVTTYIQCDAQNDKLQSLYYVAVGTTGVLYFLVGQAFDTLGPKWIAVVGALGAALFSALTALAVFDRQFEWLLWLSIPLTDLFGYMNSFALVGFIYHYPDYQALLIGVW